MFIGIEFARGIAALMVLLCHYASIITPDRTVLTFLWTGVDLFFVISGFVFAKLIVSSKVDIGYFFIRRIFRVIPLYFVVLMVYFFLKAEHPEKLTFLLNHLLFLHTTNTKEEAFYFNPAFWSLPVEMEFYLFIPFLAILARFKHSLIYLFIIAIVFKAFIAYNMTPNVIDIYQKLDYHLSAILPEFMLGIFLYQFIHVLDTYSNRRKLLINITAATFGFFLLTLLTIFFVRYGDEGLQQYKMFGGFFGLLCAFAYTCLLLPLTLIKLAKDTNIFSRLAFLIGSISYPVYLFHNASPQIIKSMGWDIQGMGLFITSIVLTIFASILLHRLIEEPARIYGRSLSQRLYRKKPTQSTVENN